MKRVLIHLGWIFVLACVAGTTLAMLHDPFAFERQIVRADAEWSENCGVNKGELRQATAAQNAVCAEWGKEVYVYSLRYPDRLPVLYGLYGNLPEFHEVVDRHGHQVVPIIWSYLESGSTTEQLQHDVGRAVSEILAGRMPPLESEPLSPIEHGARAIVRLRHNGHDMLAQYAVVDGEVEVMPVTTTLRSIERFLLGGVKSLEGKLVRGEETTAADYGHAVLDVAVIALGGHAIVVGLKRGAAKGAAKAVTAKGGGKVAAVKVTAVARTAAVGAGKAFWAVGRKVLPAAAVLGTGYLMVTKPQLLAGAGTLILQTMGVPVYTAAAIVWGAMLFIVLSVFRLLVWPFLWPVWQVAKRVRLAPAP